MPPGEAATVDATGGPVGSVGASPKAVAANRIKRASVTTQSAEQKPAQHGHCPYQKFAGWCKVAGSNFVQQARSPTRRLKLC